MKERQTIRVTEEQMGKIMSWMDMQIPQKLKALIMLSCLTNENESFNEAFSIDESRTVGENIIEGRPPLAGIEETEARKEWMAWFKEKVDQKRKVESNVTEL